LSRSHTRVGFQIDSIRSERVGHHARARARRRASSSRAFAATAEAAASTFDAVFVVCGELQQQQHYQRLHRSTPMGRPQQHTCERCKTHSSSDLIWTANTDAVAELHSLLPTKIRAKRERTLETRGRRLLAPKYKYKYKNIPKNTNTNTNTKYTCDTGQTRNKLLAQWVHLTNHAAGHSRPNTPNQCPPQLRARDIAIFAAVRCPRGFS
jgi:hypothetical protein